jgi:hypothetical protein
MVVPRMLRHGQQSGGVSTIAGTSGRRERPTVRAASGASSAQAPAPASAAVSTAYVSAAPRRLCRRVWNNLRASALRPCARTRAHVAALLRTVSFALLGGCC